MTVGPDLDFNDNGDAFVAKVNAGGTGLVYCGYIGGSNVEEGKGIAVDGSGCAYVTGYTSCDENTFPVTVGPYLEYNNGDYDAFVAKVCETGPIAPVGGIVEPVDRIGILAPWLGLLALIVVAITTAVVIRRRAA